MYKAIYIIDTYFGGIYTILTAIVYRRIIIYIVILWHFKILHDEYKLFSKRGPKKKDLGGGGQGQGGVRARLRQA